VLASTLVIHLYSKALLVAHLSDISSVYFYLKGHLSTKMKRMPEYNTCKSLELIFYMNP